MKTLAERLKEEMCKICPVDHSNGCVIDCPDIPVIDRICQEFAENPDFKITTDDHIHVLISADRIWEKKAWGKQG